MACRDFNPWSLWQMVILHLLLLSHSELLVTIFNFNLPLFKLAISQKHFQPDNLFIIQHSSVNFAYFFNTTSWRVYWGAFQSFPHSIEVLANQSFVKVQEGSQLFLYFHNRMEFWIVKGLSMEFIQSEETGYKFKRYFWGFTSPDHSAWIFFEFSELSDQREGITFGYFWTDKTFTLVLDGFWPKITVSLKFKLENHFFIIF